jgi:DNA-binding NarL/FixJ family response regulator
MIRVLVCDDQAVVREGLLAILASAPGIEVVGAASDGAEAVEAVARVRPDVVLMDLKMPVLNGIQATRRIRTEFPEVRVLVLTTYEADEWVYDAIRGGAAGYLLKDTPAEHLVEAIVGTAEGRAFVDPQVAGKLLSQVARSPTAPSPWLAGELSDRKREVLRLLCRGCSNAEIARQLFLSEGTVRNYMTSIFAKLGVSDRTQAAVLALRHGLGD